MASRGLTEMEMRAVEAARAAHHRSAGTLLPVNDTRLLAVVRAVIRAMREPTEDMLEAGAYHDCWVQCEGMSPQPAVWREMIDTASPPED